MKVIDLLNKIANGEDIPKKIKVYNNGTIYEYDDGIDYKNKYGGYLFETYIGISKEDLNIKVEIIEESKEPKEHKIPKKLPKSITENACSSKDMRLIATTLNELIDYLENKGV